MFVAIRVTEMRLARTAMPTHAGRSLRKQENMG